MASGALPLEIELSATGDRDQIILESDCWKYIRGKAMSEVKEKWANIRAWNEGYPKVPEEFTITEKVPTKAFSWLKAY